MRELHYDEINQISGGDVIGDVKSLVGGLSHQEQTLGVLSVSAGILIGGVLPKILVPLCPLGLLIGWYFYDMHSQMAPVPVQEQIES